jgi:hypothetical protein
LVAAAAVVAAVVPAAAGAAAGAVPATSLWYAGGATKTGEPRTGPGGDALYQP